MPYPDDTTTHELADELIKLAEHLKTQPSVTVPMASLYLGHCWDKKEQFLNICSALPRPLKKEYTDSRLEVNYDSGNFRVHTCVERSAVCRIVEPAKPAVYECEPLLSDAEESEI